MPKRAFCTIYRIIPDNGAGQATIGGEGVIFDQDGNPAGSVGSGTILEATDTFQTIHEKIADAVRAEVGDPSVVVIFSDSPGRY